MSAIEMMDPKMDAGMRCNRRAKKPYTFQTAKEVKGLHIHIQFLINYLSCLANLNYDFKAEIRTLFELPKRYVFKY